MKKQTTMLFAYDFPHKKTQYFIEELTEAGYEIAYVIAAPWEKLPIPKSTIAINPVYPHLPHPEKLCEKLKIPYYVFQHNSNAVIKLIKAHPVDTYVIAGARILSDPLIKACREKILNIHPGLLPEVRGLDTLLWSIYYDHPIGQTAHFISSKIDSGRLVHRERLFIDKQDTLKTIAARLVDTQSDVLMKALSIVASLNTQLKNLDPKKSSYNTRMPESLVWATLKKFASWKQKYAC